jgi:hypothetical protein
MAVIIAGILLSMSAAASEQPVGSIKTLEGTVRISRQGTEVTVTPGQSIFQHDIIRTEAGSRTGIILLDDTMLSLGPGSTLELKEYLFQPKTAQYSLVVRMLKGTFVYLSGIMAKLSPDAIRLETPDATIGIRGTRLLIQVEGT